MPNIIGTLCFNRFDSYSHKCFISPAIPQIEIKQKNGILDPVLNAKGCIYLYESKWNG